LSKCLHIAKGVTNYRISLQTRSRRREDGKREGERGESETERLGGWRKREEEAMISDQVRPFPFCLIPSKHVETQPGGVHLS